jgi:Mg2+-importing ATPase
MFSGLSNAEVTRQVSKYGLNVLPASKSYIFTLIQRQLKDIFNILLILASIATLLLGEPLDSAFIMLFVVLSVSLNLFQEYKSNNAAEKLKNYLVKTITVRRDDKDIELPVSRLVPGDILKLESGDIVPADAIIRSTTGLQIDETTFTGESITVFKSATENETDPTGEHTLLQGVTIVSGFAYAEVVATGSNTRLAQLSISVSNTHTKSQVNTGIEKISNFMLKMTLVTLVFIIIANILIDGGSTDIPHLLIFSIALAVSVIPEALPLVMTFSLSRGAIRLAEKNVLVKRLSSVQDLGSIELLCSDKTGTITENKLSLKNDYLIPNSPWHPLVLSRLAAGDLHEKNPEPFDVATDSALNDEQKHILSTFEIIEEEAFDPALRSNGAVAKRDDGLMVRIRRGSPEYFVSQNLIDLNDYRTWLDEEESLGHRVLGVSYNLGNGPVFGGFISFTDGLKSSSKDTIEAAKELNVLITIVTGDSVKVAEAIGREAGLVTEKNEVIEAGEFFKLSTLEQNRRIGLIRVFARTTPEQKHIIIKQLKEKFVVGFLGEGINDAAALKAADVSLVVKSASDVARETADIILLQSDLRVIIEGIKLGRETHANTLKYIRTTLVSNFGNFYAVAVSSLFIAFLPMLPKQILLLNLLTDVPIMAIAFDKVNKSEIKYPQKYNFRSLYIIFITLGLVSTVFDFMWFALFYQISPDVLQTNWFIGSVITEVLLLLSIRSMLPIEKAGLPSYSIMILSFAIVTSALVLPFIPVAASFFEFTTPTFNHILIIIALSVAYLVTTEILKRPVAKFINSQDPKTI